MEQFIKKYHNRVLEDWGSVVSPEFKTFQGAFKRYMSKVAESIGATLVEFSKGHYDVSGFIRRGEKYVYFSYSNFCGSRTHVDLFGNTPFMCRTAKDSKDYRGGSNNWVSVAECAYRIDYLLNH